MNAIGINGGAQPIYTPQARNAGVAGSSQTTYSENMLLDEVDISDEARRLWEDNAKSRTDKESRTGGDMTRHIGFEKKDLEGVKKKFQSRKEAKAEIQNSIDSVLKKNGIKLGSGDRLKIEFDAEGKVIVGGVKDAKTVKAIEKALNENKDLVKQIKSHREQESEINKELKDITGMSLSDFKKRQENVATNKMSAIPIKNTNGDSYTTEEMLAFKDQDLSWVDEEFMGEIAEYIGMDSKYDFATGNDILADPQSSMNKRVEEVMAQVEAAFKQGNDRLREMYDPKSPEEEAELQKMMMSLNQATISIDADGNFSIEGTLSENSRINSEAIASLEEILRKEFSDNNVTGERNSFKVAAERLTTLFDDQFSSEDTSKKLVTTFRNGKAETRMSSPKKEAELESDIQEGILDTLKNAGVKDAKSLEISLNDDGKLSVANLPVEQTQRDIILKVMEQFNSSFDSTTANSMKINGSNESPLSITERLNAKIQEFGVYRSGGASLIQKAFSSIDSAKPAA